MIKCKIKRGGTVRVKAYGTPHDLMLETGVLIQDIFQNVYQQSPEAAKEYKARLLGMLLHPKTPVWKEPDHG